MRPALALCAALLTSPALAEEVGRVGVDWVGNDIIVEALEGPDVGGVTCHVSSFERSVLDFVTGGNWFENPSSRSRRCRSGARTSPGSEPHRPSPSTASQSSS